jgi:hypothetical protein
MAEVILNHDNENVRNIGQGEARYRKYKRFYPLKTECESYITTDSQSASLSWNKAPIWGLRPDIYLF